MGELTEADLARMSTPPDEAVHAALASGDIEAAQAAFDRFAGSVRSLQHYSVEWITSLLSFVARELGEDGVERALRATGNELVVPRRAAGATPWEDLPAAARAKVITRAMLANGGTVAVTEDDDAIRLSFRCGSGGRLVDEARYDTEGGPYYTLRERAARTFMRDSLPVYCAHCSIHNELMPLERGGVPTSIEEPTNGPGGRCVHVVPKDARDLPADAYTRLGLTPPEGSA